MQVRRKDSRIVSFLSILMPDPSYLADKRIRNAAIMSVKKWVPDVKELSGIILSFALSLLERLQVEPVKEEESVKKEGEDGEGANGEDEGEAEMAMEETPPPEEPKPPFALVREGKVVDRLDPPKTIGEVTQHVELLLALCVKEPQLLDPYVSQHFPSFRPQSLRLVNF